MATPLKKRHDSYAYVERAGEIKTKSAIQKQVKQNGQRYAYAPQPRVVRGKFPLKQRVRIRKQNPFKVIIGLIFLGLVGYYVMPYMFLNYFEPMFLNRIQNKDVHFNATQYINPTRNYLTNSSVADVHLITPATGKKMTQITSIGEHVELKYQLQKLAKEYPQLTPHIYVWDYTTGKSVEIDANHPVPSASIIKIPILIELFHQIEQGKMKINDAVVLDEIYRTSGSGDLQYGEFNRKTTLNFLANEMITSSDNSATNILLDYIGGKDGLNRALRFWGMKNSYAGDWLPDLVGQNKMSAKDIATMIYNLDNPTFLNTQSKEYIREYLGNVKNRNLIQASLPDGAILYHKTGDIGKMLGDAGVIYSENRKKFIVAILVERPHNDYSAKDFIQNATKLIYSNLK